MAKRDGAVARCDRVQDLDPAPRREELRGDVRRVRDVGRPRPERPADGERKKGKVRDRKRGPRRQPVSERDSEERERDAAEQESRGHGSESPWRHRGAEDGGPHHRHDGEGCRREDESRQHTARESRCRPDRERPQICLPWRRPRDSDPDPELEEGDREKCGRAEACEQAVGLATLELPADEQHEQCRKRDGRQPVRRVASKLHRLGLRMGQHEHHASRSSVSATTASSRLRGTTSSSRNTTPECTRPATNASASST